MLIDPVHFVKTPEVTGREWKSRRSIVWLNRFDVGDGGITQPVNLGFESISSFGVQRLLKHREFAGFGVNPLSVVDERPNSLIECSSQTLEKIPADEIDRHMRLLEINTVSDLIPF